jgi:hypothetical protein
VDGEIAGVEEVEPERAVGAEVQERDLAGVAKEIGLDTCATPLY